MRALLILAAFSLPCHANDGWKFQSGSSPEASKKLFVHSPADTFPNRPDAQSDDTHHSVFGGHELARYTVEGIKAQLPDLANRLHGGLATFDPSTPDDPAKIVIPWNVNAGKAEKPDGN